MNILVTGGTGFIGSALIPILQKSGHYVKNLSRNPQTDTSVPTYEWDLEKNYIDPEAIKDTEVIIHLAGENVTNKRWSTAVKEQILDSRVKSSQLLFSAFEKEGVIPKQIISASGVNIYDYTEVPVSEHHKQGDDFLAQVTKAWEKEVYKFSTKGTEVTMLRLGLVLDKSGGGLKKIEAPIKKYVGAALGNGKQKMSWIHIKDLIRIIEFCMENSLQGPFNAVAPQVVTNKELIKSIASHLKKPIILPNVPGFIIKLIFGEMGTMLLQGNHVSCEKIMKKGFLYDYPYLHVALEDLYESE